MKHFNFKVSYFDGMINIETDTKSEKTDFTYGSLLNMYKTKSTIGSGIQVNDSKLEESLDKMCCKISKAVYKFIKETNEQ